MRPYEPAEGYEMIFESLAKFVMKHAKLIIAVWIIVLIASAYPAMHASEKLSYSTTSMGSSNTESIEGLVIIGEHFQSQNSSESMQMALVVYNAAEQSVLDKLTANMVGISDKDSKISSVIPAGTYDKEGSHMVLFAVSYKTDISDNDIAADTGTLRDLTRAAASDAFSGTTVDYKTYVTGTPAISYDANEAMSGDMARVDPISILLILILIGLFFRSFVSSAAPPITIGVSFALVLCALFFLGQMLEIYYIVEMLLIVSMLGAGCDYCIFILARYREERRRGLDHEAACLDAITWAGESVFTSGVAVMIGFGAMMVCQFRLISSMGMGLAIGILFALLAALTLMSSLLVVLGDKLFWPTGANGEKLNSGYIKKMGDVAHKYFDLSTKFSIKYAKVIVVATILFTVPMAYIYVTADDSYDMIGSMMNGESQEGMVVLTDYAGGGTIMPNYAVYQISQPLGTVNYLGTDNTGLGMLTWTNDSTYKSNLSYELKTTMNEIGALDNVAAVYISTIDDPDLGPFNVTWVQICLIFGMAGVDPGATDIVDGLYALPDIMEAMGDPLPASATAMLDKAAAIFGPELRSALRGGDPDAPLYCSDPDVVKIMDWLLFVAAGSVGTTYDAATNTATIDYINMTMATKEQAMSDNSIVTVGQFRDIVHKHTNDSDLLTAVWVSGTAAVMVEIKDVINTEFFKIELTAIILIIILLFFVMKSYLTPIRSVGTIFMSVIWTVAITHLVFDNILGDGVLWILPIVLLVVCLGLGMDYDILLTTRIREYTFSKGMDNDEAIHQAVLHSGSVITLCGLIMGGTFGTLMLSSTVMLQQMGFALCFAILVDALIVRTYIVPAFMHLMGKWNWVGPSFLKKE